MQGRKPNKLGGGEKKFWRQDRWVGKVTVLGGESEDLTEKIAFAQRFGRDEGVGLRTSGQSGFA